MPFALILAILVSISSYAAQPPPVGCLRGFAILGENFGTTLDQQMTAFESLETLVNQLASSFQSRAVAGKVSAEQTTEFENGIRTLRAALGNIENELASERVVPDKQFQSVADSIAKLRAESTELRQVPTAAESKRAPSIAFVVTRKAEKEIEGLQPKLREKYAKFIKEVSGPGALRNLRPNWRLEKIDLKETGYDQLYSVELNGSYRLIFRYTPESGVLVIRASQTASHAGH